MQDVAVHVRLPLKEPDTETELGGDVDFLVARNCTA